MQYVTFFRKHNITYNDEHYANRIIKYLEGKGISWVCWVFDPEWGPVYIKDGLHR